jgi:hypothetical protein
MQMTIQADGMFIMPRTNSPISLIDTLDVPSRRRFRSQAAGAAAGGTVLALAAVSATVAADRPAAAPADREPDPIFAKIEAHRVAERAYAAACSEQSRREQIVLDEGIGLRPFAVIVNSGLPIVVYSHPQINGLVGTVGGEAAKRAHDALDAVLARYETVMGNIENEAGEIGGCRR